MCPSIPYRYYTDIIPLSLSPYAGHGIALQGVRWSRTRHQQCTKKEGYEVERGIGRTRRDGQQQQGKVYNIGSSRHTNGPSNCRRDEKSNAHHQPLLDTQEQEMTHGEIYMESETAHTEMGWRMDAIQPGSARGYKSTPIQGARHTEYGPWDEEDNTICKNGEYETRITRGGECWSRSKKHMS